MDSSRYPHVLLHGHTGGISPREDHSRRDGWTTWQETARLCISLQQRPTDLLKTSHSGEAGSGTVKLELPESADPSTSP